MSDEIIITYFMEKCYNDFMVGGETLGGENFNREPGDGLSGEGTDYPPFNPELAKQLYEKERAQLSQESSENKNAAEIAYDPTLYNNLSEYMEAQVASKRVAEQRSDRDGLGRRGLGRVPSEQGFKEDGAEQKAEVGDASLDKDQFHEFKKLDSYQQNILLTSAADSLVNILDLRDMSRVDQTLFKIQDEAKETGASPISVLNRLFSEADAENDEWGAVDLRAAFIDLTSTYIMDKAENPGMGAARGVMNKMNMLLECRTEEPNSYLDGVQLDKMYVEPIIDEYLSAGDGRAPVDDLPSFLNNRLAMEELGLEMAKKEGESVDPDAVRRVQALRSTIQMLFDLLGGHDNNMKCIRDTAAAHHWILS